MIRRYLIAGLLIWVPLWVTWIVIKSIVTLMDRTLSLLPKEYQPDHLLGFHLPGLGVIFTVLVVFFTGMLVTNFIGYRLVIVWEGLLSRIPLVRTIYNAVKQLMNTIFSSSGDSFRKVLLIEYPRQGIWSIGFQTNSGFKLAPQPLTEDLLTVFIPTTPNPTSGFIILVPKSQAMELPLSVDEGLKLVISLGVVMPDIPTKVSS